MAAENCQHRPAPIKKKNLLVNVFRNLNLNLNIDTVAQSELFQMRGSLL